MIFASLQSPASELMTAAVSLSSHLLGHVINNLARKLPLECVQEKGWTHSNEASGISRRTIVWHASGDSHGSIGFFAEGYVASRTRYA